jgi:nucleotide-binding universal stress UspA family protein
MSDDAILLAYDDSEPAQRALHRAAALAKAFGSKLIVTSVAPVSTPAGGRSIGADPVETSADHLAELAGARAYLEGEGLAADYIEGLGHPAEAIVEAARQRSAGLIVVGARDLSMVQRLLGQSVSDAVSHHARCDVLIVH